MADILSFYGKRVDHRGYMYYSPFREEAAPSMRVTVNSSDGTWIWADFGGSPSGGRKVDGGGCLDLVRRLGGLSSNAEAAAVLGEIARNRGAEVVRREAEAVRVRSSRPSGVVIDDVSEVFTRKVLRNYVVNDRCIPESLLKRYCRQVTYHSVGAVSRRFTVVGFPNNAGGWAMRGCGRVGKMNNVWGLSTFGPDGTLRPDASAAASKCALFEGFMDFLSWLSWRGVTEPGMDVCVLHSASNAVHAKDYVLRHGEVRTFFDNDRAGDTATDLVRGWCEESGKGFKDGRAAYQGLNDVNDAWCEVVSRGRRRSAGAPSLRR